MSENTSQHKQIQQGQESEMLIEGTEQYEEEYDEVQQDNDDDEHHQTANSEPYEQTLTNQPLQTPAQQFPSQQLQKSTNSNKNPNKPPTFKKSSLLTLLNQLQSLLFHQIILKTQLLDQPQQTKQIIKKLSAPIEQRITEIYEQIKILQSKLERGLLMSQMQCRQVKQKILQKRMHELADTSVLCNLYRHHNYRLLLSTLHITLLYQNLGCHEQALTHLQFIKLINQKYKPKYQNAKYMHAMILTLEAMSKCEIEKYVQSVKCLDEASKILENLRSQGYEVKQFFMLITKAKVFTCDKQYTNAIQFATNALQSAQLLFTQNSLQSAQAYKCLSQAQAFNSQFPSSIQHITKAIQILQHSAPQKQQLIIQYYTKLSQITFKQLNSTNVNNQKNYHFAPFINVLREKYQVIENTYGYRDKRAIKDKRNLAKYLLEYQRVEEAEEEFEDILEIQQIVYGEKSVEVAKTLKKLGNIAVQKSQTAKAEKLFRKSMGIFHDQGEVGLQKQVQGKILVLTGKGRFVNIRP